MLKDYLNKDERLTIIAYLKMAKESEKLVNSDLLETKEKGNMKRGISFLVKSLASVIERLNPDAMKAFNKAIDNTQVFTSCNDDIDIYYKRKSSDMSKGYEENKDYFKLVELMFDNCCKDCKKCGKDCDIYKEFEARFIPELDPNDHQKNCKYAYRSEDIAKRVKP